MENKDFENIRKEINTSFPMEFPSKKENQKNHIADVVVNEIYPPASSADNKNSKQ